ncbi:hypothetical protein K443DRAFT_634643 [Laccaria amethystina LaAM-08-1]|uniref:Uncharacterized protein n=1 Tax=Laccaria amethystina LaAM-08-1 TaxID=1095629 RepID=A0A0C9XK49_9AGAR|nr:hypothetical protein K443DRAFT_634643 [Laccaria amethystina LaAM-08-1]
MYIKLNGQTGRTRIEAGGCYVRHSYSLVMYIITRSIFPRTEKLYTHRCRFKICVEWFYFQA